jgi:hypothetical protein
VEHGFEEFVVAGEGFVSDILVVRVEVPHEKEESEFVKLGCIFN